MKPNNDTLSAIVMTVLIALGSSTALAAEKGRALSGDAQTTASAIDRLIDQRLKTDRIPASPIADDAEFLRRVTLDLTGRIPTYDEAVEFLANDDA
ncbi:MAG: DUF1549 domain-containing protein, partial [Planctomycetes bacterium]|nr:DUF1549 domain-containing protein [Planctomycetota bacterium]